MSPERGLAGFSGDPWNDPDDPMAEFLAMRYKSVIPLRASRSALVVIDMQNGFLREGSALMVPGGRALIPVINEVIRSCRRVGVPVVFTQFVYDPRIPSIFGELHPEHKPVQPGRPTGLGHPSSCCLLGDESTELDPELDLDPGDLVLQKPGYDAFHLTPLDGYLRLLGVDTLMLAGVLTDVCVWHTISGAIHRNYRVAVLRDAVGTLSAEVNRSTLNSIGWSVARVVPAAQAIRELEESGMQN